MAEKEMQAHDMVRRRSWSRAVALYDPILAQLQPANINSISSTNPQSISNIAGNNSNAVTAAAASTRSQKDRQIACLLGRCECLLELSKYESCLADARKVLVLLAEQSDCLASISRARRWLIHALCKLKKYTEAEQTVREWISEIAGQQSFADISKTLERYKSIIQMINGHKTTQKISLTRLEDEMSILDTKLDHWATNNLPLDKYSKLLSNKGLKKREGNGVPQQNPLLSSSQQNGTSSSSSTSSGSLNAALFKTTDLLAAIKMTGGKNAGGNNVDVNDNGTTCSYCAITFQTRNELRQHCQTESHQNVIMSDEGRDWKWRPPPRGFTLDSYSLCESYTEPQSCQYGNQCVEAHGLDELNEWKERFEYRRMRLQKACEKELYGKSYTEQVLERWIQATAPERIMTEKVDDIEDKCEQELVTSISSKSSIREWIFVLKTRKQLRAVALLQDAHRNHFAIKSIKIGVGLTEVELKSDQEWVTFKAPYNISSALTVEREKKQDDANLDTTPLIEHQISIEFHTEIYGTFRQAVCFDFGQEPLLVKHLCVDVVPVGDAEKIEEIKRDIINSSSQRWDVSNTALVKFETTIGTHLKTEAYLNDLKHEKEMLERYPCPRAQTFTLTQSTIVEKRLTQNNYRSRIHELLYVEEIARYEQIARYNVRTKLTVTSNYILTPAGMATSTAKYSLAGELFALMRLGKDISEDTSAGRLILSNCSSVYISAPEDVATTPAVKDNKKRSVFEAVIEDKGKNVIYLKLSAKCVEAMSLKADTDVDVDIQFQLNRLPYCEWHNAVDKITDFKIIFPATEIEPNIPWTPKKQWSETCEPKLNAKQREAVNAITTSLGIKLPPILLIGPFGTGKTYTLAQAIKQLLSQPEAKILICTHSNSAADLYIKEYLHPWIEEGMEEATPLRVYYHKRWVATVNSVVQKYCITDGAGNFRRPSVEDIMKHRIVVVTLSISMELATLGLPKGYFTHIFLDEAAQAMECEAIMPLALANDGTRIVLAGDHMQMSPELFSAFAKERKLHISLLERLYGHYPSNFPCKILLCENYRAHEAIIKFTSELFYEQKLIASGKQPRHERFYPLTFFTTRGEDVQDKNSTAFYNNAEVYEVVERVSELRKKWPSSWGKINDASIGIMTPYADQVFRIRSELRKRRMGGISVERVLNVQGKQFRAVFLSTVRTRRTCLPNTGGLPANTLNPTEDADYGFLSNSKLLNTAITRAQSLVAVVGDPVALCSIGRCRKVWERFIEICDENKSLFGLTWGSLRSQLDGVELKRGYVLNPLAPEFIPRALQPEAYLRDQAAMYLLSSAGPVNNVSGHHGPGHHNTGPGVPQHGGMMGGPGGVQVPPHHPGMGGGGNQQMPHMYAQHPAAAAAAYNAAMMNQGMPGKGGGGGGHHFPGHPNHMPMRPLGPPQPGGGPQQQQPPPLGGQQFNPRGPPPPGHLGQQAPGGIPPPPSTAAQFSQYMAWQAAQLRGGPPPSGGGFPQAGQQGGGPPNQNPNASLWGPPPQNNPWGALPKQQPPPPPSAGGRPIPPQQPVPGMRGPGGNMQPPAQPPTNQQQMRGNPSDLGYLAKKTLYGQQHPPQQQTNAPPHGNFPPSYGNGGGGSNMGNPPPPPPNQLQMLNQRNVGGMPNGPISPMDPFMLRQTGGSNQQVPPPPPPQNNFFGGGTNNVGVKDKDFQFLNNVHVPLNVGGTMFQTPPGAVPATANKQQSPSAFRFQPQQDYSALLPPNMNIYEMAFEPKESQYKWYLKLLEIHGQEAANKFTEVLRQVMTMIHQQQSQQQQQQQQGKPPQMHPPHLNAAQMLPRELIQQQQHQGMPPILGGGGSNQINPQMPQQQQQRNSMPPYLGPGINAAVGAAQLPSLLAPNDETQPLDGNINFNQQIDLVFNSLMNGNEISQPILRDLLGMVGGSNSVNNSGTNSNMMNSVNGDLMMSTQAQQQSKVFPIMGANINLQQQQQVQQNMKPPHIFPMHMQQQQQPQPPNTAFMGNNALLNNKDLILGGGSAASSVGGISSSSVPLYRRQAMAMGNGNINSNYNSSNSSSSTGAHSIASSTPDNILNSIGGANEILSGLGGTTGNLIDSIFQTNPTPEQQQSNTAFQKLLYNNYATATANLKPNELDLLMRMERDAQQLGGVGVGGILDASVVNSHHQQQQSQQHQHHHAQQQQQQQQLQHFQSATVNTAGGVGTSGSGGIAENRNTTYAAVLSQGPQQLQQHVHHQHAQHEQQQQQQHAHHNFHGNMDATGGSQMEIEKDPFAAIRELGQGTNGFYNYFQ